MTPERDDCTEMETLLAFSDHLEPVNERRLERHLASCARCGALAVVTASTQNSGVAMTRAPRIRAGVAAAIVVAAAACLLVLLRAGERRHAPGSIPSAPPPISTARSGPAPELGEAGVAPEADGTSAPQRHSSASPSPSSPARAGASPVIAAPVPASPPAPPPAHAPVPPPSAPSPASPPIQAPAPVAAHGCPDEVACLLADVQPSCCQWYHRDHAGPSMSKLHAAAMAHYAVGRYERAARAFARVYDAFPHRDHAYNVAVAHMRAGDCASALAWMRHARRLARSSPPGLAIDASIVSLSQTCPKARPGHAPPVPSVPPAPLKAPVAPAAPDEALPEKLGRADITRAVAGVRTGIAACGEHFAPDADVRLRARMLVEPSGKVSEVAITGTDHTRLVTCVKIELLQASFPPSKQGISFTYPFLFRPD